MNSHCSMEQLESALAGTLPANDETELHRHLEACESCSSTMEHLAGGAAWCGEAASLLAIDELDADIPIREEFSEIDFTVEHLQPSDDPNALGQLGGYDVLGVIGRGGMGVVLKGYERALKRCVAIKVLAPHLAQSSLAKKRFAREAQAAAAVVHPNVLAIHQVQPTGRLPFLVMPLVAGESLAQRLAAKGSLEITEILRIGMQAAAGLAAAHEQGLVHRDVKPANILLEKGVERAVLTDFGLARAADDVALTRWGIIAGTPQYMSPEQAKGEPVDGRSDLFSLGCVLYEMATGVSPFRTESTMATLRRLIDEEPQAMSSLNPELPPWFIGIVEKLLEKDPSKRFSSAKEVCDWLEGCLAHVQQPNNVSLPAGLPTVAVQTKPGWGIARWIATIAATLLLGALGAGAVVVATADPPDISGQWTDDLGEWGTIELKQVSPSEYTGTYSQHEKTEDASAKNSQGAIQTEKVRLNGQTATVLRGHPDDIDKVLKNAPVNEPVGKIELKWSRIERQYTGTWKEGQDRFGDISVQLAGDEIRGAYTTSRESKVNPATPKLAPLTWSRQSNVSIQVPGKSTFGPVIERVVNVHQVADSAIDFDTGEVRATPKASSASEGIKWLRERGIDAGGVFSNSETFLIGADMIAVNVTNDQWDCSPESVTSRLAQQQQAPKVKMSGRKESLATYLFQTREGGKGVLQITGFTDNPRGVKIRYKLLRAADIRNTLQLQGEWKNAPATETLDATTWKPSFGPVIERVVNDDNRELGDYMIDLDSGNLFSPPKEKLSSHEELKWIRENGIDALGDMRPGAARLVGLDMIAIPVGGDQWDCTPQFLLELFAKEKLAKPDAKDLKPAPVVMSTDPKNPLPTYFFQTREGGKGVLQITGAIDNGGKPDRPRSVKIRYKLLQDPLVGILSPNLPHKNAQLRGRSLPKLVLDQGIDYLFTRADLQDCNFEGAKLIGGFKSFSETNFSAANLIGANLSGNAAFQRAKFDHANLSGAALQGDAAGFQESSFKNAILNNAKLTGGVSAFQSASFQQADMTGAVLEGKGSAFQLANFDSATLHGAKIVSEAGTAFQSVSINGTDFSGADLATIEPQSLASCRFAPDSPPKYSPETKLPAGFDPVRAGWKKVAAIAASVTDKSSHLKEAPSPHLGTMSEAEAAVERLVLVFFDDRSRRAIPAVLVDTGSQTLVVTTFSATRVPDGTEPACDRTFLEIPERSQVTTEFMPESTAEVMFYLAEEKLPNARPIEPVQVAVGDSLSAIFPGSSTQLTVTRNAAKVKALDQAGVIKIPDRKFERRYENLIQIDRVLSEGTPLFKKGKLAGITLLGTRFLGDKAEMSLVLPAERIAELCAQIAQAKKSASPTDTGARDAVEAYVAAALEGNSAAALALAIPNKPAASPARLDEFALLASEPYFAGGPLTMTVEQRSATPISITGNKVSLALDDITRGQVTVRIVDEAGKSLAGPKSVRRRDAVPFRFDDTVYVARLVELSNALIGNDFAKFEISPRSNLKIEKVLVSDNHARGIAISEKTRIADPNPDGRAAGILTFELVKQNGKWLLEDIDFDTEAKTEEKLNRFVQKYQPDVVEIPAKPAASDAEKQAKLAPYSAIRWRQIISADGKIPPSWSVQVVVDGQWYELLSLNDLSLEKLVEFARQQYGDDWQKRFNEDLVELLGKMDQPPKDTVKLVLRSVQTGREETRDRVPLTAENRKSIWLARKATESSSKNDQ